VFFYPRHHRHGDTAVLASMKSVFVVVVVVVVVATAAVVIDVLFVSSLI
jgi:hypothetical protein